MNKILIVLLFTTVVINAQNEEQKDYSQYVTTLDSTIATLYSVISGDKGEKRDWNVFKHLFHENAKLIPTGKNKDGEILTHAVLQKDGVLISFKK